MTSDSTTACRSEKDMPCDNVSRFAGRRARRCVTALPLAAQAQRKSPLADAPAIRKRFELRATRFELGAGVGYDDQPGLLSHGPVNVKLGFHITDWLSIAGFGGFAVATSRPASRTSVVGSLHDAHADVPREPTQAGRRRLDAEDQEHPRRAARVHAVHRQVLAVRQALRALRLLRASAAGGFINVEPAAPGGPAVMRRHAQRDPDSYSAACTGLQARRERSGVGLHSFFNHWLALNVELRDIAGPAQPVGPRRQRRRRREQRTT